MTNIFPHPWGSPPAPSSGAAVRFLAAVEPSSILGWPVRYSLSQSSEVGQASLSINTFQLEKPLGLFIEIPGLQEQVSCTLEAEESGWGCAGPWSPITSATTRPRSPLSIRISQPV